VIALLQLLRLEKWRILGCYAAWLLERRFTIIGLPGVISPKTEPSILFLAPTASVLILWILLTARVPNWELNESSFRAFRNMGWRNWIESCTPQKQTWLLVILQPSSRLNLIAEGKFETYLELAYCLLGHRTRNTSSSSFQCTPMSAVTH
jgi:hypothetical protein